MTKITPIQKEINYLYNKHNKTTKFPLSIENIEFPPSIIEILEKNAKRTKLEQKKLNEYRNRILSSLSTKSYQLYLAYEEEKELKRKLMQEKIAKNKDNKFKDDPTKIKHFGIWFDKCNNLNINRETYAAIDKKAHFKFLKEFYKNLPELRSRYFEDENCTIYSDFWCEKHREDCLENFDLNMKFYNSLDYKKFDKALSALIKKRKKFKQIYDINDCENIEGIYILVLDEYKQIYIGQSKNIKKRILQHWRKKKEFDKLIDGRIETSILSIDAFGCLDTTRIFILETNTWSLDREEEFLINSVNKKYLANRTAGGIRGGDSFAQLQMMATRNGRIM